MNPISGCVAETSNVNAPPAGQAPSAPQRSDEEIMAQARQLAEGFQLVVVPDTNVGFLGYVPELPGVCVNAQSQAECWSRLREALEITLATILDQRVEIPCSEEGRKDAQINFRVRADEKEWLEEEARQLRLRGVSEIVRKIVKDYIETRKAERACFRPIDSVDKRFLHGAWVELLRQVLEARDPIGADQRRLAALLRSAEPLCLQVRYPAKTSKVSSYRELLQAKMESLLTRASTDRQSQR